MECFIDMLRRECSLCKSLFLPSGWQKRIPWNLELCRYCRRARSLVDRARGRSVKLGLTCALDERSISLVIKNGVCQVSGIPFEWATWIGHGPRSERRSNRGMSERGRLWSAAARRNPFTPSIDRIDVDGDYVMDNIRVVVWILNNAYGRWGNGPFMELAWAMVLKEIREGRERKTDFEQLKEEVNARLIHSA